MARFLALDLGAESGRGVVGILDNNRLQLEPAHRFANTPVRLGNTLYWDLPRLMEGVRAAIAAAAQGGSLDGMGVDTWGVDFGLLDAGGALLGLPVHYRDRRTDGLPEKLFQTVSRRTIYQSTGIQTMPINTLFQIAALAQSSPKMLEAAQTLLFMPDLIHYYLSGQAQAEYTIASTSQMLNARTRTWDMGILDQLGLPTHFLPTLAPDGTSYGTLLKSESVGNAVNVPIIAPGGHDTACAVAAVPALESSGWAYLSSGTWSLLGVEVSQPIQTDETEAFNFTNEGGVCGTIRLLKNIGGLWLVQECRRAYARLGSERTYEQLTRLAGEAVPLAAVVNPDHATLLAPDDMPKALRELCAATGQTPPEGVGATIRCCLDSLGLKYRWTLERLEQVTGQTIHTLHIVGGGAQNKLLNQIAADATGRTVIAGPVEATAIGNILLQARALGYIASLGELRQIVRDSFPVEMYTPDAALQARYDEAYKKYEPLLS